jgi:hypothetical protein
MFPKEKEPSCIQEACWILMGKIMGHPKIAPETKMAYWKALPTEAWPRNWQR